MATTIDSIDAFRDALDNGPYAFPGGYPMYGITSDGAALSFDAMRENQKIIEESIEGRLNDGWRVVAIDVNWEDPDLICDHTGERIESAYADD